MDKLFELMKGILARDDLTPELFDSLGKADAEFIMSHARKNEKILDFGCGLGRILKYLPETAEGYDPNPEMRQYGEQYCGRKILGNLEGKQNYYNIVVAILVVQHSLAQFRSSMEKQIADVLKPRGRLITLDTDPKLSLLPPYEFADYFELQSQETLRETDITRIYRKKGAVEETTNGQSDGKP